jgi:hypothetical protein
MPIEIISFIHSSHLTDQKMSFPFTLILKHAILLGLLLVRAAPIQAKTPLSCGLVQPSFLDHGSTLEFRIKVDCSGNAPNSKILPSQPEILVGLTVYGPLTNNASRTSSPRRSIITDNNTNSFDLPVQRVPLPQAGSNSVVTFQAKRKDLSGTSHWLFAAWPLSARQPCNRTASMVRSGCRHYGYELVSPVADDNGVKPLASYPGLVIDDSDGNRKARWIVEKFR